MNVHHVLNFIHTSQRGTLLLLPRIFSSGSAFRMILVRSVREIFTGHTYCIGTVLSAKDFRRTEQGFYHFSHLHTVFVVLSRLNCTSE
jgi:hypothetical protein